MQYHVEVNEDLSNLSKKENEIYGLAAEGLLRPAIAKILNRSPGTINTHFNHILQKLDAENIQQAIAVGFIKGILACRDKLPAALLVCVMSVGGMLPGTAMARSAAGDAPWEQPFQRAGMRGNGRTRGGSRLQLRTHTRTREAV